MPPFSGRILQGKCVSSTPLSSCGDRDLHLLWTYCNVSFWFLPLVLNWYWLRQQHEWILDVAVRWIVSGGIFMARLLAPSAAYFGFYSPGRWILDWSGQWMGCLGFVTLASKVTFVFVLVPVARTGLFVVITNTSALNQLNIFIIPVLWHIL